MKLLVVFASFLLAVHAATDAELWNEFKKTHGKVYRSLREDKLRFSIFQDNLRKIEAHNALYEKGDKTYYMTTTMFADLTTDEFKTKYLTFKAPTLKNTNKFVPNTTLKVADSIDWRQSGAVLEVKNQGQCGGCWAFSCTGALEGQNFLRRGVSISLSEQELLDCSTGYGNAGCDGGVMEYGFDYIQDNGLSTEEAYPYTATDNTCYQTYKADISVTGYSEVDNSEDALKQAVGEVGPISVAINADTISFYGGGVFYDGSCSDELNHGVLAVGYGTDDMDYWLIKNSWGADWGENGYIKMARNQNSMCGISNWNVYPNVAG